MRIGLTGNIGTGKSTVAKMFAKLGACVLDADPIAHTIYNNNPDLLQQLQTLFGKEIVQNNQVQRSLLGSKVFSDLAQLQSLNQLLKPFLRKRICEEVLFAEQQNPIVILEASLLFENDFLDFWDSLILVTASDKIRLQRVIQRGLPPMEAQQRMDSQQPQEQKIPFAKYHICNETNLDDLEKQVLNVWSLLRQ